MSKIENKWGHMTTWERKKAYEELSELIRNRQQKEQPNQKTNEERKKIEERIKNIRKTWPIGIRIT